MNYHFFSPFHRFSPPPLLQDPGKIVGDIIPPAIRPKDGYVGGSESPYHKNNIFGKNWREFTQNGTVPSDMKTIGGIILAGESAVSGSQR